MPVLALPEDCVSDGRENNVAVLLTLVVMVVGVTAAVVTQREAKSLTLRDFLEGGWPRGGGLALTAFFFSSLSPFVSGSLCQVMEVVSGEGGGGGWGGRGGDRGWKEGRVKTHT